MLDGYAYRTHIANKHTHTHRGLQDNMIIMNRKRSCQVSGAYVPCLFDAPNKMCAVKFNMVFPVRWMNALFSHSITISFFPIVSVFY